MAEGQLRETSPEHDSESNSSDDNNEREENVESLVAGRERRATAGNRLSSLLEKEGDDDLELLFAENEEEEDVEFEGVDGEDASDVQLDSSSDDEDQGPTKGEDDLDGEKELQKQDRAERQKGKRKAADIFKRPPSSRKRLKTDPTSTTAPPVASAPRTKKKSERLSWVPTSDEGPTRFSSRRQTIQNKEVVHARMKASEKRRLQQIAIMEEAAKRKESIKPKALTQADRMAEAARTEKKNAKSLTRWEETEKKRVEEQKAKLAALHNRQLEGPVISWWSGIAKWVDGKMVQFGVKKKAEDAVTVQKKEQGARPPESTTKENMDPATGSNTQDKMVPENPRTQQTLPSIPEILGSSHTPPPASQGQQQIRFALPQGPQGFLDGIHFYASLPQEQQPQRPSGSSINLPPIYSDLPIPAPPPAPPAVEYATRNMVTLKNVDANATRVPELQNHALIKKRVGKLQKPPQELCAVTMQPAKFRDPKTGLAYANAYAYKEMQKLQGGGSRWSDLLECYVGPAGSAARGVPERFFQTPAGAGTGTGTGTGTGSSNA